MKSAREQRTQRRLEETVERSRREKEIKGGIGSLWESLNPAQKIGMSPVGFSVTDIIGAVGDVQMYRDEPETRSLANYALSGLGLLPFAPSVASTVLKKGKAAKKYGDYLYHITPTKNIDAIKKRGLSPIETSNYLKATGSRYQEEPRVFAWTNPVDAMHFLNRMHGPFGADNMDEFSLIRIKKRKGKWEKDLALDPHMSYSNIAEIQDAEGLVSMQTRPYTGIDSADIIDHIEVKALQKELGDFIPSDLVYPGKGSYTGAEYSDAVTDLMNKGVVKKKTGGLIEKAVNHTMNYGNYGRRII